MKKLYVLWMVLGPFCLFAQTPAEERIRFTSIVPSEQTGQDYTPWLNDDVNSLVADAWQNNLKYIDVTLKLAKKCQITRLSLYDYQGVFTDQPAYIYALNGTQRTLIGKFEGTAYMAWVDLKPAAPITADAVVIYKYGNNIPQKINVFGTAAATTPPPTSTTVAGRIPIEPKRWYQVNNVERGLDGLFDGKTGERVNTGWGKLLTNYDAYYPLLDGEQITISRIRFFDGESSNEDAPVTLSIINSQWQRIPIARFVGNTYQTWVGPDPANPTQFDLRTVTNGARYLVLNTSGAYPDEMELYGSYTKPIAQPNPAPRSVALGRAMGVNAFEWNVEDASAPWQVDESRVPALKSFSAIRHYMDWEKLEGQPGQYSFNPTYSGSWNYDVMYERLKTEGIEVLACLKTIPKWLEETYPSDQRDYENVPARWGSDLTKPQSYIEQARVAFQYTARYGSNINVDRNLVKVSNVTTWAGTNQVKIGLGLIRYIECENERDKTWKGRKAYQSAREYAANLSAFYDGHKNTMGPGVGAKNADPTIKVVVGGLAASTTDYIRAMIDWCKEFRGYKANGQVDLCWDVMNQHLYADNGESSQNGTGSRGAAPELSSAAGRAAEFVAVANQWAGGMPVWITEAGYDTHPGSPFRAIPIGNKTVLQTQADWILRTALLHVRLGIDRLFFYQMYDDNPTSPIQFSSMGLINDNRTRKPAADYLYQVNKLLGAYAYKQTLSQDPIVDRYEVTGSNGQPQSAYMLVIPDERGRTATYKLNVGTAQAQLYVPKIGSNDMIRTTLTSTNGVVTVNVSETPVFVLPGTNSGARVSAGPVEEVREGLTTLQVYPNPATDYVDLTFESDNRTAVDVTIYDAGLGRAHRQVSLPKPERRFSDRIDVRTLPYGLYILEVRQGLERTLRKVIKVQ